MKSKQKELEDQICTIEAKLKSLQATLRQKEDEAAELQRERVSGYIWRLHLNVNVYEQYSMSLKELISTFIWLLLGKE